MVELGLPENTNLPRLLARLREIERLLGRPSHYPRNVSRPIDLDILYAGSHRFSSPDLTLPHPRLRLRRFVLEPLAAIRPDLVLPGEEQSIAGLLRDSADAGSIRLVQRAW